MNKTILLCTVGGSHEPILTSIEETGPDFICFMCSGKDPRTGKPGSETQITGAGSVIEKKPGDEKPTLPNIPAQAGLSSEQYEVVTVPADELDKAFAIIWEHIEELIKRYPDSPRLVADYTGGTKSMAAALVLAAVEIESEQVELQLTTGPRTDLKTVRSGAQTSEQVTVELIRARRDVKRSLNNWEYFAYGAAAEGLRHIKPRASDVKNRVRVLEDLSKAFDAWDRFDHQQAWNTIDPYRARVAPAHKHLLDAIWNLKEESIYQPAARLLDLWLNALRRAEQGRFDDAVARCYRLLEWTAQWILRERCGIADTGDIPPDKIPQGMPLSKGKKGGHQAGLTDAWQLVGLLLPDSKVGQFSKQKLDELRDHIQRRNQSILAHGDRPVSEGDWQNFNGWMESKFLPLLREEATEAGLRSIPRQLPQRPWPEIDLQGFAQEVSPPR